MGRLVRRRRRSWGPFYENYRWFWWWPTSWGIKAGRESYNVTNRQSWFRLPFRLGDWVSGGRRRRRDRW